MFIIEGMDKARRITEENRKRKLTKHKKPSNTMTESDNCSPLEILKLQKNLLKIAGKKEFGSSMKKGTIRQNFRRT